MLTCERQIMYALPNVNVAQFKSLFNYFTPNFINSYYVFNFPILELFNIKFGTPTLFFMPI